MRPQYTEKTKTGELAYCQIQPIHLWKEGEDEIFSYVRVEKAQYNQYTHAYMHILYTTDARCDPTAQAAGRSCCLRGSFHA